MLRVKPTIYIETSVISYLTSRPSRDLVVAGHQQITTEWWERDLPKFTAMISPVVIDEISQGDPEAAAKRREAVAGMQLLTVNAPVLSLAAKYFVNLGLPENGRIDALHLAVAAHNAVNYLVTWNCRHIANGKVMRRLAEMNLTLEVSTPTICTPEELLEYQE
jgi:predicted nucleic acid-binding protein